MFYLTVRVQHRDASTDDHSLLCCVRINLMSLHLAQKYRQNDQMSPSQHLAATLIVDQEIKKRRKNRETHSVCIICCFFSFTLTRWHVYMYVQLDLIRWWLEQQTLSFQASVSCCEWNLSSTHTRPAPNCWFIASAPTIKFLKLSKDSTTFKP